MFNKLLSLLACSALAVSLLAGPASAKPFEMGYGIDQRWEDGIKAMYALDFNGAEGQFRALLAENPSHPAGNLALACLMWWRMSQNFDVEEKPFELENEFFSQAEQAIEKSETMLKTEKTAQIYFTLGTAQGMIGRWYALQRRWWKAYVYGSRAKKYLDKAVSMNPEVYDAYLGMGIYNYYGDTIPGVMKLPALLLIHGDKKKGLAQIRLAVEKGRFFPTEARLFLINILIQFEKQYPEAVQTALDLIHQQPDNVFFQFVEVLARYNSHDWMGAIDTWREFLARHQDSSNDEVQKQLPLVYLIIGNSNLMLQQRDEAMVWLGKAINETRHPEKGWVTFAYLRRAQLYDLLGNRAKAVEDYTVAASRPEYWDSRKEAKRGLKKPYTEEDLYNKITSID
ncbi:MAG: hypothetical protein GX410_07820 [Elusimicrobia bacterium]|nr:hypothetical protein [Elusimicrobiota bacterium]